MAGRDDPGLRIFRHARSILRLLPIGDLRLVKIQQCHYFTGMNRPLTRCLWCWCATSLVTTHPKGLYRRHEVEPRGQIPLWNLVRQVLESVSPTLPGRMEAPECLICRTRWAPPYHTSLFRGPTHCSPRHKSPAVSLIVVSVTVPRTYPPQPVVRLPVSLNVVSVTVIPRTYPLQPSRRPTAVSLNVVSVTIILL